MLGDLLPMRVYIDQRRAALLRSLSDSLVPRVDLRCKWAWIGATVRGQSGEIGHVADVDPRMGVLLQVAQERVQVGRVAFERDPRVQVVDGEPDGDDIGLRVYCRIELFLQRLRQG